MINLNRYEKTKKVGLFGILANLFLMVIKFSVAFISHSKALLADAFNSTGDIFSSLMTFIGNKIASTPSDEDHNFGHGKAEYIFSLLISIFMILIAIKIFGDSLFSIIKQEKFTFSYSLIIVCIITIILKFILFLYCRMALKDTHNILIKASMNDHKNDCILTLGTLLSIILSLFGYYFFDGIFGAINSIYIFISAINIFIESYNILMDISLDKTYKDNIIKYILKNKDIKNVRDFYAIAIGYKYVVILTIDVDGNLNTFASHDIADNLELSIIDNYHKISKVIIHVNPV